MLKRTDIVDVGYGGSGVGRIEGKVVMVPGALPGETVDITIRRRRQRWDEADLQEVIVPSPHRRDPDCPLAMAPISGDGPPACPGCAYQHAGYALEKQIKQRQLADLLQRFAGLTPEIEDGAADLPHEPLGYRNKMVLQAQRQRGAVKLGYALGYRDQVLDVKNCPIAHPALNEAAADWRSSREMNRLRNKDRITFRHTQTDGAVAWKNEAPENAVWLRETTSLGQLAVPWGAFFQVNPVMGECLTSWVRNHLAECRLPFAVDLYCGVGVFALNAAAAGIPRVTGIDQDGPAIKAARHNAEHLGYPGVHFITQPAGRALRERTTWPAGSDSVAILDPPRAGLDTGTLAALSQWQPRRIMLISCAPDTLCRDLKHLTQSLYDIERIAWFNMFPRTACFETAVWLALRS